MNSVRPARIGQRPGDPARPPMRWQVLGQMTQEVAHPLAGRSHQGRRHRRVERHVITAGQRGDLRRVRRAAEESQQGHVVHARTRGRRPVPTIPTPAATARTSATRDPSAGRSPDPSPTTKRPSAPRPAPTRPHRPSLHSYRHATLVGRDRPRPPPRWASGCRYLGSDIIPYARVGRRRATTRSSSTIARRNVSQSSCLPTSCS